MIHFNEGFIKTIIMWVMAVIAPILTGIGGFFLDGYFEMRDDLVRLKTTTVVIQAKQTEDMARVNSTLENIDEKMDIIIGLYGQKGPAFTTPSPTSRSIQK